MFRQAGGVGVSPRISQSQGGIAGTVPRTSPDRRVGATRRILVAGVGYGNLRDLSVGPLLVERWRGQAWPPAVELEDLSFGAVAVLHWFQANPPFSAAIFVAAAPRGGCPGSVHRYTWDGPRATADEVQQRVAEAVTGIISLDTLLTVVGYFGGLPPTVIVVEVEPRDRAWGTALSPVVEAALDEVERTVHQDVQELLG